MRPTIDCLNESTVVSDTDFADIIEACQLQISNHFSPFWNINAILNIVPKGQAPARGRWWFIMLDDSDQAGALGYHDLTPVSQPLMKVFARTDLNCGAQISNTCSHEFLEGLADPFINECVANFKGDRIYAKENCDATEDDSLGYTIQVKSGKQILVSDFVTPQWFVDDPTAPANRTFDYLGHCTAPFQVLPGGYISYLDLSNSGAGWQEYTPEGRNIAACKPEGSRYDRRRRFRGNGARKVSTAHTNITIVS